MLGPGTVIQTSPFQLHSEKSIREKHSWRGGHIDMSHTHTLTRHRDIQSWVVSRKGSPAIALVPDRFGTKRAQLLLRFARSRGISVDDGMSPCSWTAWLAELDRQQLALRIDASGEYELVSRSILH